MLFEEARIVFCCYQIALTVVIFSLFTVPLYANHVRRAQTPAFRFSEFLLSNTLDLSFRTLAVFKTYVAEQTISMYFVALTEINLNGTMPSKRNGTMPRLAACEVKVAAECANGPQIPCSGAGSIKVAQFATK